MTVGGSRAHRKAAAWRRRLFLVACGFALGGGAFLFAKQAEVPYDVATARSIAHKVAGNLAPEVPQKAQHLRILIDLAEKITVLERQQPIWRRNDESVAAAWGRALDLAITSLRELREQRVAARERWSVVEKQALAALVQARSEVRTPGLSRTEQSLLQQAEVAFERAKRLAQRGAKAQAAKSAELTIQRSQQIHNAFTSLLSRFSDRASLSEWRAMVDATIAESAREKTTVFVVDKLRRQLDVYNHGKRVASFDVELGSKGLRRKMHAGDKATPEGRYRVTEVRTRGQTRYYKALMLDYPNAEDRNRYELMRRRGQIPKGVGMGSLIEIHGDGGKGKDWTDGCIALTNNEMDKLFQYARVNTVVTIVGTVP
ncbi:MAG TPA: L,D-transpeptidase [Thermoanaerobaculia bacterium]|nr:L,D-transpeptidase [Thermoanaerobaculia bacterium]